MVRWGINWTIVSMVTAALAAAVFMGVYARLRWWRTGSGQNVMTLSALILAIAVTGALYRAFPWFTLFAYAGLWLGVAVVLIWRTLLLVRAQAERRGPPRTPDSPH